MPTLPFLVFLAALIWRTQVLSLAYSNLGALHQSKAELGIYSWPEWPIQDDVRRTIDLDLPIAHYNRSLELNPENATANRRLGQIELSRGNYESAVSLLAAARSSEPGNATTSQLLAEALIVTGQEDQGQVLWSDARNAQGQLGARIWWYEHIGEAHRAERLKKAVGGE
jgi:tetratricopeptide (TPR) repeat protein